VSVLLLQLLIYVVACFFWLLAGSTILDYRDGGAFSCSFQSSMWSSGCTYASSVQ
jgi:hypothetical protein